MLAMAGALSPVSAAEFGGDSFTLRGFGTLGITTHDGEGLEFRRDVGQLRGVTKGELRHNSDSLAGLQVSAKLASRLDAVAQGLMRMNAEGNWQPQVSQAFLRWTPDESLVMRAGRFGYGIVLLAESRQVGYSYLPVRPPPEFYGQLTNDEIDGLDVTYTRRAGPGITRLRLFAGEGYGDSAFPDGSNSYNTSDVYGASVDYLFGGWTARVAVMQLDFAADPRLAGLIAGLQATGFPDAQSIANDLSHGIYRSLAVQFGLAYDHGPFQTQVLYGTADSDTIAGPDVHKFYVLFGFRLRHWTPFVSFANSRDRAAMRSANLPAVPEFAPLIIAVEEVQRPTRSTQYAVSAGVRFDLSSNVDFKLQVDRVSMRDSFLILDRRVPPGGDARMTVVALTMDFVF
jgi:hypothetical protein